MLGLEAPKRKLLKLEKRKRPERNPQGLFSASSSGRIRKTQALLPTAVAYSPCGSMTITRALGRLPSETVSNSTVTRLDLPAPVDPNRQWQHGG